MTFFRCPHKGNDEARAIMREILELLTPIGASGVGPDGSQPDTGIWINAGLPGASLWNQNEDYFRYHHTLGV